MFTRLRNIGDSPLTIIVWKAPKSEVSIGDQFIIPAHREMDFPDNISYAVDKGRLDDLKMMKVDDAFSRQPNRK